MAIDVCGRAGFILRIAAQLLYYVRILVPILLVIMIIFDLVKIVVGQVDDKAKKEATNKITKRAIYAIIVFLVPTIINLLFVSLGTLLKNSNENGSTTTNWVDCWKQYYK